MKAGPDIALIASLVGDPARANMLTALMSGGALTASELAHEAGVTLQTGSSHLAKLEKGGLITLQKQGRHRYFRLSGPDVPAVLEGLMGLAARAGHLRTRTGPKDPALRRARVCYDHLAGDLGVELFDSLVLRRLLAQGNQGDRTDAQGRTFSGGVRDRSGHCAPQPAAAVQALPRLERAPQPPGRVTWRGAARQMLRPRLGKARSRHADRELHPGWRGALRRPSGPRRLASASGMFLSAAHWRRTPVRR